MQRQQLETFHLKAYPASNFGKDKLGYGNRVLFPDSVLQYLNPQMQMRRDHERNQIFFFSLVNVKASTNVNFFVGAYEFTANKGQIVLPDLLFNQVCKQGGDELLVTQVKGIPKAKKIVVEPQTNEFILLASMPTNILQEELPKHYVSLSKGEIIQVKYMEKLHNILIIDVQPPSDFSCVHIFEGGEIGIDFKFIEPPVLKPTIEKGDYDPRKHRLLHGLRQKPELNKLFTGQGQKISDQKQQQQQKKK